MNEKINSPADGSCGYLVFSGSGRIAEGWADSLLQAKERGIAFFKTPKSKRHLVHVALAEKRGQPVVNVADF